MSNLRILIFIVLACNLFGCKYTFKNESETEDQQYEIIAIEKAQAEINKHFGSKSFVSHEPAEYSANT